MESKYPPKRWQWTFMYKGIPYNILTPHGATCYEAWQKIYIPENPAFSDVQPLLD